MADKKPTKKTKIVAKSDTKPSTLSLPEQLAKKRTELLEAQRGLGSTLQNPHIIKQIKKDIARIMTKINQKGDK